MAKIRGIGGIFFKCSNPEKVKEWYHHNLGLDVDEYGSSFHWLHANQDKAFTQWSPFPEDTDYFFPAKKEFMINYIVDDLDEFLLELKAKNITILDEIQVFEYGKFLHIIDLEGNKIELWQPL